MKRYQGFVWLAKFRGRIKNKNNYVLFGPGSRSQRVANNVEVTGYHANKPTKPPVFYLYRTSEDCVNANQRFRKYGDFISAKPAYISMTVAESRDEFERLPQQKSLVVIARNPDMEANLLVVRVASNQTAWGHIPGEFMRYNGMTPYHDLFGANYGAQEACRQEGCNSFIATWSLVPAIKIKRRKRLKG